MEKAVFDTGDIAAMKGMLDNMHVADIAEEMENMDEQLTVKVFRMLPKDTAAEVFAYLSRDTRGEIVKGIADRELSGIMDELFIDDAVDFIEEMPANVVNRILAAVPPSRREMINNFLKYPEDSAGSIMTIEYVSLKVDMTVGEAFSHIREMAIDKETIYTCYVIDQNRHLTGVVSAKKLLLADTEQLISDIMSKKIISAHTTDDKEELVSDFMKYDLLAMPIVDSENRLVGIVTIDDVLDVQEEEATEDFEIMAAISPSDEPYLKTGVVNLTKNRVLWLLFMMLSATITGAIISGFEDALALVPALVASIPMLMDTGGNAGAQSSTMIIRGMAIDEIQLGDAFHVLWKELRVAVLCGAALFLVNFARILIMGQGFMMALTVSLTLYCTVIMAKALGCMLPLAAKKVRIDPAVMAAPLITTIVDAASLIVYFGFARLILNL
ncbi:MAG: magnesium transporter [Oscillospiraceae bacterium]|nr:magnesium transporter [Oscillospiraceae bacterium]